MICLVCGSTEITEHAGISYCAECSTQTAETREDADVSCNRRSLLSSPSVERKTSKDKTKTYSDWISAECYNVILHKQVCALIKLGASPNLKGTVLHIWSKYLQKCEVAFRIDYAKEGAPHLGPHPLKRDLKLLYGDKRISARKVKKLKKIRNGETTGDESNLSDGCTTDPDSNALSDASVKSRYSSNAVKSLGEESNISDGYSGPDSNTRSDANCKPKYSSHAKKVLRKSRLKKANQAAYSKLVHNMNLPKTLSFCYLGLMYTEHWLSLSDLIRFAYEGKIPYINIIDELPDSLNFQHADSSTFLSYMVPDAHSILKTSHEIVKFLKLPKYKEPSVLLTVSRFLKELNLPDDLRPIIKMLYEPYKIEVSKSSTSAHEDNPSEFLALALIIVALKMLFILDDKFEIEHSEAMVKLNAIKSDCKYFVWTEWREQASLKEYLFLNENPGYCAINKIDSLSTDRIISKYPHRLLKPPSTKELQNCRNSLLSKNEIKNMLSSLVDIPSSTNSMPTSFPLICQIKEFIKEWKSLHMFKETQEIDFTLLEKDFSSYSLSFNPLHYDADEDELTYLLITSLYIAETSVSTRRDCLNRSIHDMHNIIRTTSGYWFVNSSQKYNSSEIISDWVDKVPSSFKWLMDFICKYTNFNSTALYKNIIHIEKLLFFRKKSIFSSTLNSYRNKITVDL